jgi:glycine reductase complex component B subunit gamma
LATLSQGVGANRIVAGKAITNPTGDPSVSQEAELILKKEIVTTALKSLESEVDGPTLFYPAL